MIGFQCIGEIATYYEGSSLQYSMVHRKSHLLQNIQVPAHLVQECLHGEVELTSGETVHTLTLKMEGAPSRIFRVEGPTTTISSNSKNIDTVAIPILGESMLVGEKEWVEKVDPVTKKVVAATQVFIAERAYREVSAPEDRSADKPFRIKVTHGGAVRYFTVTNKAYEDIPVALAALSPMRSQVRDGARVHSPARR